MNDFQENALDRHLSNFRSGRNIKRDEAETLFDLLISCDDEQLIAALLGAWNDKGITEGELFYFASIMRNRMRKLASRHEMLVDIVGTGGSRAKTFNISTAAAFVIAGAGIPVAKHGNSAATSNSGSADALSSLGINADVEPETAEKNLDEHGLCFIFAPRFHSLSLSLAKARRSLGRPTIFNNLGPLCNPASAQHQLIGVWNSGMLEKTAKVLARLGTGRSWIVHSEVGLDEIGLNGKTSVAEVSGEKIATFDISAGDFGIDNSFSDLPKAATPEESASLIRRILSSELSGEPAETIVLLNAAAAIYLAGRDNNLNLAFKTATESIRSGMAANKLLDLVRATNG